MLIIVAYLLVSGAVTVLAIVSRARAQGPNRAPSVDPQAIPIEELALLAGGLPRAVTASALVLYEAGAITPGTLRAHFSTAGPVPQRCHEFSAAVHALVGRELQTSLIRVRQGMAGSPEMRATRNRLVAAGLLPDPDHARALRKQRQRLLTLVFIGVLLLPVAFVVSTAAAVLMPLAVIGAAVVAISATRTPPVTLMGAHLLAAARNRAAGFAAGGLPGQRAIALALFGPTAIRRADPALADQLGLSSVRSSRRSSSSDIDSGCGGGCGGGSDSGGGGGGGCGGGGGGCGGGG